MFDLWEDFFARRAGRPEKGYKLGLVPEGTHSQSWIGGQELPKCVGTLKGPPIPTCSLHSPLKSSPGEWSQGRSKM